MAVKSNLLGKFARLIRRFARDASGATAILFAVALPVLLMAVGGGIDYASLSLQKSRLQVASDAAAVAAARELHLANAEPARLQPIVESVVNANLGDRASGVDIKTTATVDPLSVTVDLKQSFDGYFLKQFMKTQLGVHSVARVSGGTALCVLALDEHARGNITLEMSARLTGNECAVYSNSRSATGVMSKNGARLEAGLICSTGGAEGGSSNFEPEALTDCPPMEDPLANRPEPRVGSCTETDLKIGVTRGNTGDQVKGLNEETIAESQGREETADKDSGPPSSDESETVTLKPGTYCGGIAIGGTSKVTLLPGIYVIKDGPLFVTDFASLEGKNVGFYFVGTGATLFLDADTTISLAAPESGPMAGLLFFQSRSAKINERFSILSDNARVLEGTLYIPKAHLYIDADEPIADQSAYTVIISNSVSLFAGPHVVLNTDYEATDVPVPAGIAHDRIIKLTE